MTIKNKDFIISYEEVISGVLLCNQEGIGHKGLYPKLHVSVLDDDWEWFPSHYDDIMPLNWDEQIAKIYRSINTVLWWDSLVVGPRSDDISCI